MNSARILSRRCNLRGIGKIKGNKSSTTTTSSFGGIGASSRNHASARFGSRSRHCSSMGSYFSSLSAGNSVSKLFINSPSAVTSPLSSLLEYEEDDLDGT